MKTTMTPAEQKQAISHLVTMRYAARRCIQARASNRETIAMLKRRMDVATAIGNTKGRDVIKFEIDAANERQLEIRFKIIEVGKFFIGASGYYDQLPREVWLRALCVNESDWNSPDMRKHGDTIRNVVAVLKMENSATKDDAIENKPLHWCCTMGMMHTADTNPELGRVMHDACNEVLGGVFGEYQEPTMLERMGVS